MTIFSKELFERLNKINENIQQLFGELEGRKVPVSIKRVSESYTSSWVKLNQSNKNNNHPDDQLEKLIKRICTYANNIGTRLLQDTSLPESVRHLAQMVVEDSRDLTSQIDNQKVTFDKSGNLELLETIPERFYSSGSDVQDYLNKVISDFEAERKRNSNSLASIQNKIEEIEQRGSKISSIISTELSKIEDLYEQSENFLETKRKEVNKLTESISKDVYSGNYEIRASKEETIANSLRTFSLWAMLGAIIIIIATVIEASFHDYTWTTALLRIGLIFAVSVPAAYLARESTRHRERQNSYMEKSLDLKAVSPFISSLEKIDQDKIKIDLSDRLFATNKDHIEKYDEIPINAIEAALKIIEKSQK